jgi:hypothetical protein
MLNQFVLLAESAVNGSKSVWDILEGVPPNDRSPLMFAAIITGGMLLVILVVTVSKTVIGMHKARLDDALKRELVDRGFTADEIAKIVETSPLSDRKIGRSRRLASKGG